MNCIEVRNGDTMERYLRSELSEEDSQQFEEHYFSCDDCYESLRDLSAARTELASDRWAVPDTEGRFGWVGGWGWALAAAMAILAVGLVFFLRDPMLSDLSDGDFVELAAIQPPPYEPVSLRGPEEQEVSAFEEAMIPYQQSDYLATVERLEPVVQSEPLNAAANFYLGTSYLLTDRPGRAVESLGVVVELGESRFQGWARFYRAKAYLRLGNPDAASVDLKTVVSGDGELAAQALEILGQL